jgi:ribonuclease III
LSLQALTHRSWCAENGGAESNERLEFLGDSVLGLVVTNYIYREYPQLSEGELAKLRAAVVSSATLADVARDLDLGQWLRLGKGEHGSGGRSKSSILADAMEAVIGATYIDGGWQPAEALVLGLLAPLIAEAARIPGVDDFKTRLQEHVVRNHDSLPRYLIAEEGPDHEKRFFAQVVIAGTAAGRGEGRSKKQAEQAAAAEAWDNLDEMFPGDGAETRHDTIESATNRGSQP